MDNYTISRPSTFHIYVQRILNDNHTHIVTLGSYDAPILQLGSRIRIRHVLYLTL